MPHKCNGCNEIITPNSESIERKCNGCGTSVCGRCNVGGHIVCPTCVNLIKEKYEIPEIFYNKNYLKKQKKEAERAKDMEELLNETDTDFTQRNIPSAQRANME